MKNLFLIPTIFFLLANLNFSHASEQCQEILSQKKASLLFGSEHDKITPYYRLIRRLKRAQEQNDTLSFISYYKEVAKLQELGFKREFDEYWRTIKRIFDTTFSMEEKAKTLIALVDGRDKLNLLKKSNYSQEFWGVFKSKYKGPQILQA